MLQKSFAISQMLTNVSQKEWNFGLETWNIRQQAKISKPNGGKNDKSRYDGAELVRIERKASYIYLGIWE